MASVSARRVLWLGGGQWAGKTSVARELSARHGLHHYQYDYHDARGHYARAAAEPARFPRRFAFQQALADDPNRAWVTPTPRDLADWTLEICAERFQMVLEDLDALPRDRQVIAEGFGLRPDLVATQIEDPREALFLVPTEAFRRVQGARLERATSAPPGVSDPARAVRNRWERDRLLAEDVVRSAALLGLTVIHVDGSKSLSDVVHEAEMQFLPLL